MDTLTAAAKCFDCLSKYDKLVLQNWFLAQALKAGGGPDFTNINDLTKAVACFDCLAPSRLESMMVVIERELATVFGNDEVSRMTIAQFREQIKCWSCVTPRTHKSINMWLTCLLVTITPNPVPCWVAREVYGQANPKWVLFAFWLLQEAPAWLRRLYLRHGQSFANWIADKPALKRGIRRLMDRVTNA